MCRSIFSSVCRSLSRVKSYIGREKISMRMFIFDHCCGDLLPTTLTHQSPLRLRSAHARQAAHSARSHTQQRNGERRRRNGVSSAATFHWLIKTVQGAIDAAGECRTGATPATSLHTHTHLTAQEVCKLYKLKFKFYGTLNIFSNCLSLCAINILTSHVSCDF